MAPFPPIKRWRLPQAACELTRSSVMPAGRRGDESGVFWLGRRDQVSEITAVVFPTGDGVRETQFSWSVSAEVYAAVSAWAKPRGLALLGVAHTHLSRARPQMSRTDRFQGPKVPDALSIIVPAQSREPDPSDWAWFVYTAGDYRQMTTAEHIRRVELTDGKVEFAVIGSDGRRMP
jgi:hypothetical protein